MNEKIEKILNDMDRFLEGGSMWMFLYEHRKLFHYKLILTNEQKKADIAELDMSVRSNHCLYRAGYKTIGSVVDAFSTKEDATSRQQLQKIRNLGKKSAQEILLSLMCYQYEVLPEEKKRGYVFSIVEANM